VVLVVQQSIQWAAVMQVVAEQPGSGVGVV